MPDRHLVAHHLAVGHCKVDLGEALEGKKPSAALAAVLDTQLVLQAGSGRRPDPEGNANQSGMLCGAEQASSMCWHTGRGTGAGGLGRRLCAVPGEVPAAACLQLVGGRKVVFKVCSVQRA